MSRFTTYWDKADERASELEEKLGQAETERDILRELVEEARELLKEASFPDDPGAWYDTQHWLADADLQLEAQ